jgi:uncharacterized membrane-anchored protein
LEGGFVPLVHPDRGLVDAELHARQVLPLEGPLRVRRAAFMADGNRARLRDVQTAFVSRYSPGAETDPRQLEFEAAGYRVTAEIHNEFATLTWIGALDDWTPWPDGIGLDFFRDMPLIAATRLDLLAEAHIPDRALAGFDPRSLCYSTLYAGTIEAATDFSVDRDGFTRFEVAAGSSGGLRRGTVVRRLLEIDTYRALVLLGLPLARQQGPKVTAAEEQLSALMRRLSLGSSVADNQQSLDALHGLSLEVERTRDETSYRFAATRAYAEVLRSRIARLGEVSIGEFTAIARYLENRVDPAVATCVALETRLEGLARKLERSTELLNARINLSIETQNQAVLDTISRTARNQYHLQRTVEGLSVIVISYYALSLVGEVEQGLLPWLPLGRDATIAISVPIVIVLVWLALRFLSRRGEPDGHGK